jgi:hypothetical protein
MERTLTANNRRCGWEMREGERWEMREGERWGMREGERWEMREGSNVRDTHRMRGREREREGERGRERMGDLYEREEVVQLGTVEELYTEGSCALAFQVQNTVRDTGVER